MDLILGTTPANVSLECFFYDKQALLVENPKHKILFSLIHRQERLDSREKCHINGMWGSVWLHLETAA